MTYNRNPFIMCACVNVQRGKNQKARSGNGWTGPCQNMSRTVRSAAGTWPSGTGSTTACSAFDVCTVTGPRSAPTEEDIVKACEADEYKIWKYWNS